jgi:hypothetical protein
VTNMIYLGTRPDLLDLWISHRFDSRTLATEASVPHETVLAMMSYFPVERSDAEKVLDKLSAIIHRECTLSTVYVPLIEEGNTDGFHR